MAISKPLTSHQWVGYDAIFGTKWCSFVFVADPDLGIIIYLPVIRPVHVIHFTFSSPSTQLSAQLMILMWRFSYCVGISRHSKFRYGGFKLLLKRLPDSSVSIFPINSNWLTQGKTSGHQNLVSIFQVLRRTLHYWVVQYKYRFIIRSLYNSTETQNYWMSLLLYRELKFQHYPCTHKPHLFKIVFFHKVFLK